QRLSAGGGSVEAAFPRRLRERIRRLHAPDHRGGDHVSGNRRPQLHLHRAPQACRGGAARTGRGGAAGRELSRCSPKLTGMQEGFVERGGVRLHYLEWAPSAPVPREPILFLHGLSSNARFWERLAERLPERRLIALDQRSHGMSDRPAAGYSHETLVA